MTCWFEGKTVFLLKICNYYSIHINFTIFSSNVRMYVKPDLRINITHITTFNVGIWLTTYIQAHIYSKYQLIIRKILWFFSRYQNGINVEKISINRFELNWFLLNYKSAFIFPQTKTILSMIISNTTKEWLTYYNA